MAAFVLTLAIFITGGMSQALAAEQKETPSALKKCLAEPFGKKLECIKKNARSEAFALLGIVVYLGASYDWKDEIDAQFPGLREKIADVKGAAPLIESKMKEYIAAKEKNDPELADIYKNTIATIESQKRVLGNVRDIAHNSARAVKVFGDLVIELTPVIAEVARIGSDPEINAAFDKMNAGFKEMDTALYGNGKDSGLIAITDSMVKDVDGMNQAIQGMQQGLDQMNRGIDEMNQGVAQVNRGIDAMNRGIAEANRGMEQANRGVTGMNKAIRDINDAIKSPISKDGSSPFKDLDLSGIGDYVRGHPKEGDDKAKQVITSLIANLLPGVGDAKGVSEAIAGKDVVTGEKLSTADRILGAVIFARWIKAGKDIIKAEDLIKSIKAEKATGKIDGWLSRQAWDKVPGHLKSFEKPTNKGVGYRWNNDKGDGVRIDKGNPNNSQEYQQVDHVVINSGGKVIGRNGKPISGSIKQNAREAHIPLEEWLKWTEWNKP